eukprot:scaffold5069_cov115-Isochrysis_galbana.AAC.2
MPRPEPEYSTSLGASPGPMPVDEERGARVEAGRQGARVHHEVRDAHRRERQARLSLVSPDEAVDLPVPVDHVCLREQRARVWVGHAIETRHRVDNARAGRPDAHAVGEHVENDWLVDRHPVVDQRR